MSRLFFQSCFIEQIVDVGETKYKLGCINSRVRVYICYVGPEHCEQSRTVRSSIKTILCTASPLFLYLSWQFTGNALIDVYSNFILFGDCLISHVNIRAPVPVFPTGQH